MTKISFITSCYNGANFLDGLCKNILQQTYQNWQHIIVDSASTDDSVLIAEYWTKQDPRFKLIRQDERKNYGISWLDGWKEAEGDIVGNANCDDLFFPWSSFQFVNNYKNNKDCAVFYGGYRTVENGITLNEGVPQDFDIIDWQQFFRGGPRFCWRNNLKNIIEWNEAYYAASIYNSAFDYWLTLKFLSLGYKFFRIPAILSIYNKRAESLENSNKLENTFQSLKIIETFFPNSPAIINLHTKTKKDSPDFYEKYLRRWEI